MTETKIQAAESKSQENSSFYDIVFSIFTNLTIISLFFKAADTSFKMSDKEFSHYFPGVKLECLPLIHYSLTIFLIIIVLFLNVTLFLKLIMILVKAYKHKVTNKIRFFGFFISIILTDFIIIAMLFSMAYMGMI
ncbi:hypothetical protein [Swingsia samuiensis]|uniref:DUF5658 domain-containing protein n=1 Tax=Swingsia samuiensis TaxID=1293412 RepID=A0A4Y6UM08_9PROT|nr:hypothetical protein [Swingsia samuiensis]QDH17426.1 hypothetical protein E3D00_07505 [Swingsia samuiensis]